MPAWREFPYHQAFRGETHFQHRLSFDRSSMTRWRKRIRPDDPEALPAGTVRVAVKTGAVSQRRPERITVDTTVRTGAAAPPAGSHLIVRAIEWLNRAARRHTAPVLASRPAARARREASRLMDTRGHKQGLRRVRRLRAWPGRPIRGIRRKTAGNAELETAFREAIERAEKILTRQETKEIIIL